MELESREEDFNSNIENHFSVREDEGLCKALMEVQEDAIGTIFSKQGLWECVLVRFNLLMDRVTCRTPASLMCRWLTIRNSVNKFCGCLKTIEHINRGWGTTHDNFNQAKSLYAIKDGEFRFESCWNILKKSPLFCILIEGPVGIKATKRKRKDDLMKESLHSLKKSCEEFARKLHLEEELLGVNTMEYDFFSGNQKIAENWHQGREIVGAIGEDMDWL
ncbi:hypothetical protein ACHQM5_020838 [Ranunculus cassubicifolius]